MAAHTDEFSRYQALRHGDYFHRQRERAQVIGQLGLVDDTDEPAARTCHDFLAGERPTTTLNQLQVTGGLVSAIHIQREIPRTVEVQHWQADSPQALTRGLGACDHAIDLTFDLDQRIDEEIGGRAGTHANNFACFDKIQRCLGGDLLLLILPHGYNPRRPFILF